MKDLKRFLQENYPNIQAFDSPNWSGDFMEVVYDKDRIQVLYCPDYTYIEIFGLTPQDFESLLEKDNMFSMLRTFTEDEM